MSHHETKLENPYPRRGGVSFVSFPWIDQYTKKNFGIFLKKGVVSRVLGEVFDFLCCALCGGYLYDSKVAKQSKRFPMRIGFLVFFGIWIRVRKKPPLDILRIHHEPWSLLSFFLFFSVDRSVSTRFCRVLKKGGFRIWGRGG